MREVYLKRSYGGEVVAGSLNDVLTVQSIGLKGGERLFFVTATSEQEDSLMKLGFVMNPDLVQEKLDAVRKPEAPVQEFNEEEPTEYFCLDCSQTHQKGTPSYHAHLNRYLTGQWASNVAGSREEGDEEEIFTQAYDPNTLQQLEEVVDVEEEIRDREELEYAKVQEEEDLKRLESRAREEEREEEWEEEREAELEEQEEREEDREQEEQEEWEEREEEREEEDDDEFVSVEDMTVSECVEHVSEIEDAQLLKEILVFLKDNPDIKGRKGKLKAVRLRLDAVSR